MYISHKSPYALQLRLQAFLFLALRRAHIVVVREEETRPPKLARTLRSPAHDNPQDVQREDRTCKIKSKQLRTGDLVLARDLDEDRLTDRCPTSFLMMPKMSLVSSLSSRT